MRPTDLRAASVRRQESPYPHSSPGEVGSSDPPPSGATSSAPSPPATRAPNEPPSVTESVCKTEAALGSDFYEILAAQLTTPSPENLESIRALARAQIEAGASFERTVAEIRSAMEAVVARFPEVPLANATGILVALFEVASTYGAAFSQRSRELARSQTLLKQTLESIPVAVAVVETNGDVAVSNKRWRDEGRYLASGGDDRALPPGPLSKNLFEVWQNGKGELAATAARTAEQLPALLRGETDSIDLEYDYEHHGSRQWHDLRIRRFSDPNVASAVIVDVDVTDQRIAQVELEKSRERLELAMEATNDALWDFDIPNDCVFFAKQLPAMLGFTVDDHPPNYDTWKKLAHPEDWPKIERTFLNHLSGRTPTYACDYRLRHADGHYLWFSDRGKVIERDEEGHPLRCVGVLADINERKQAEAEIRALNAKLDARVKERTAELENSNKELAAFSYSVSHDLRAPLRTLAGYSSLLVEESAGSLDGDLANYVSRIAAASERMSDMIDNLLRLARLARQTPAYEAVPLSEIASEIFNGLRESDRDRDVTVSIAPRMTTTGDPGLLRLVLENLLGNAWKFTSKRADAKIDVGAESAEDGTQVFFVRDNGAGFDRRHADKLFGAFQRLHHVDDFEGNGIGLATVARIVGLHGGRVWADGKLDRGATFYFTLSKAGPEPGLRAAS